MIRFVLDAEARLVPDLAEHLPGRGVWLLAERDAITKAVSGQAFSRALKRQVNVPPDLIDHLDRALRRRCVEAIGLARRAGAVVAGFDQVAAAMDANEVAILLVAADASPGQRGRLERRLGEGKAFAGLTRAELGRAFGRDELVFAAVQRGRLADRLERDLARLAGLSRENIRQVAWAALVIEGAKGEAEFAGPELGGDATPHGGPADALPQGAGLAMFEATTIDTTPAEPVTNDGPDTRASEHRSEDNNAS